LRKRIFEFVKAASAGSRADVLSGRRGQNPARFQMIRARQ
jgi:hypothetical protein